MKFDILLRYIICVPAILIAVTITEFTKATFSTLFGDTAPRNDKRLTLNPFKHFEPIGFLLILFLGYGWGKPVRTSSFYYKKRTLYTVITYTAPIIANLLFSAIFALCIGFSQVLVDFGVPYEVGNCLKLFFNLLVQFNINLALFNIIPIAPLCGSKIMTALMSPNEALKVTHYEKIFQIILVMLMLFEIVGQVFGPVAQYIINFYNFILAMIF